MEPIEININVKLSADKELSNLLGSLVLALSQPAPISPMGPAPVAIQPEGEVPGVVVSTPKKPKKAKAPTPAAEEHAEEVKETPAPTPAPEVKEEPKAEENPFENLGEENSVGTDFLAGDEKPTDPAPAEEVKETPTLTKEDVRAAINNYRSKGGDIANVRTIVSSYGVKNVTEIPDSVIPEIIKKINELKA